MMATPCCPCKLLSTSLRWYYPDQVLRVSKAHFDLSLSEGTPSGCFNIMQFLIYVYHITPLPVVNRLSAQCLRSFAGFAIIKTQRLTIEWE